MMRSITAVVVTLLLVSVVMTADAGVRSGNYLGGLRGIKELSLDVGRSPWGIFPGIRTSDVLSIVEQPILNIGIRIADQDPFGKRGIPRMTISIQSHQSSSSVQVCTIKAELTDELSFRGDPRKGLFLAIWQREFSDSIRTEDAWVVKAELTAMMAAFVMDYLSANTVIGPPDGSRTTTGGVYKFSHKWGKDGTGVTYSGDGREIAGPLAIAEPAGADQASAVSSSLSSHGMVGFSSSGGFALVTSTTTKREAAEQEY